MDVMNTIEEQEGDPDMVDKVFDELEAKGISISAETSVEDDGRSGPYVPQGDR